MNTQVQEKVAILNGEHDLVKGEYSPEEAKDILNHLIAKKINFHKVKTFSHDIRYGKRDEASEQRIVELKRSKKEILALIAHAEETGKNVRIHANILIDLA